MSMSKIKFWLIAAISGTMLMTSCDKNHEEPQNTLLGGEGRILVQTTVKNPNGDSGASYMQQIPELSGNLDISKAIQTGFYNSISIVENEIFVMAEYGGKGSQSISKYIRTPKGMEKVGELHGIPESWPINLTSVSAQKAYVPLYSLGRVLVINPQTMTQIGEIDLKEYAHGDASSEPASGIIRDGYYYLPLNQIGADWLPYENHRQSDVVIIDTKTDKVVKVISEAKSGLCFPTRPMAQGMIFANEQKDIYIACCGLFGFNPNYLKNGFICIPAGKQEFDTARSWDISNTTIQGTNYKPASVYNTLYLGNGKLAAYVNIIELSGDNPYTARNNMAVIIDLNAKTIKRIEGIPETDGYSSSIEQDNGEVYFSVYGVAKSGIFAYNPTTEAVRQVMSSKNGITSIHFF